MKEGKKIECDDDSCFELIDGFIVQTQGNGMKVVNSALFFEAEGYKCYIEEPEPLKFEVNRAYKTREGLKVFLFEIRENKNEDIVLCFIGQDNNYKLYNFTTNAKGQYDRLRNIDSQFDIVGYWEEEKWEN